MPSAPLDHLLNPEPSSHSNSRQRQQPAPRYPPAVASRHINSLRSPLNLEGSSTSVLDSNNDTDTDDIFTFLEDIDDSEAEEEEDLPTTATNMPAATRNSTRRHSVVDLTDTPDTHSTSRRRKRSEDEGGPAPRKRGRVSKEDVEEIDLAEDENPSAEEELRQAQQQDAIRAQQAEMDAGAKKLGKMQCIICMESYTDATATACGHFYCHECLHQSLLVGERGDERKGTCPVCRKTISRKKRYDIIPMSFMTKKAFLEQKAQG